jgi:hypothetical protein
MTEMHFAPFYRFAMTDSSLSAAMATTHSDLKFPRISLSGPNFHFRRNPTCS